MAKTGTDTTSCSRTFTRARGGVGIKSSDVDLVDFSFRFFLSEMLLGKNGLFFRVPLSLKEMESGGLVVEAMAAVFRAETYLDKSLDLDIRADSILETVLDRQALAKEGSCCSV